MDVYVKQELGVRIYAVVTAEADGKKVITLTAKIPKKSSKNIIRIDSGRMKRALVEIKNDKDFRVVASFPFSYRCEKFLDEDKDCIILFKPKNGELVC